MTKAKEKKIAPYRIFSDRTAIELANKKPILIQELYDIHGLAEIKIGEYGEDIIEIITEKGWDFGSKSIAVLR